MYLHLQNKAWYQLSEIGVLRNPHDYEMIVGVSEGPDSTPHKRDRVFASLNWFLQLCRYY